jgi:hypothetical protein
MVYERAGAFEILLDRHVNEQKRVNSLSKYFDGLRTLFDKTPIYTYNYILEILYFP